MLARPARPPVDRRWSSISRAVTPQPSSASAWITAARGALERWPACDSRPSAWLVQSVSEAAVCTPPRLDHLSPNAQEQAALAARGAEPVLRRGDCDAHEARPQQRQPDPAPALLRRRGHAQDPAVAAAGL